MAWFKRKAKYVRVDDDKDDANANAAEEMTAFEAQQEVPHDPREWPAGKASYLTYGKDEDMAYGEGATGRIGPAEVKHHDDGSVSVAGKKVDDPEAYKGKPITGGIIDQLTKHADRNRELREQEAREGR
jgi:hypothetical protein